MGLRDQGMQSRPFTSKETKREEATWPGAQCEPRRTHASSIPYTWTSSWLTNAFCCLDCCSFLLHHSLCSVTFRKNTSGLEYLTPKAHFRLLGKVLKEATMGHGVKEVGERVCVYLVSFSYRRESGTKEIPTEQCWKAHEPLSGSCVCCENGVVIS